MQIKLTLETVTPLFLAGFDQQHPELRPAAIRGALRFWLRAGFGGITGDLGLNRLRDLEAAVFGRAERGSPLVVQLLSKTFRATEAPLLPHRNQAPARAVPPGTTFDLVLATRPGVPPNVLEIAIWSLLVWLALGGWGRRSRRGAGSTRIVKAGQFPQVVSDQLKASVEEATKPAQNAQMLANRLKELLDQARQAFARFAQTSTSEPRWSNGLPTFPVLCPDTQIIVWTPEGTNASEPDKPLARLMNEMSQLKASLGSDFSQAFGGINPRRASPLLVTAHQLESEWALVLTHLKAQIQKNDDGKPHRVTEFLNRLSPKWDISPSMVEGETPP